MIYTVVIRGNLPQLLFALRPNNERVPGLESSLHRVGNVHTLDGLDGCDTMLPVYYPEPPFFNLIPRDRPLRRLWHDANCLLGTSVRHVEKVVPHLLHPSFLVRSDRLVKGSKVKLVNPHLPLLVDIEDEAPLAFHPEPLVDLPDRFKVCLVAIFQFYRHLCENGSRACFWLGFSGRAPDL